MDKKILPPAGARKKLDSRYHPGSSTSRNVNLRKCAKHSGL